MKFIGKIKKTNYIININELTNKNFIVKIDSILYKVILMLTYKNYFVLSVNNKIIRVTYYRYDKKNNKLDLLINNIFFSLQIEEKYLFRLKKILHNNNELFKDKILNIYSPISGLIKKINPFFNNKVKKNDTLLIIEAMKMENEIKTIKSGIIKHIFVKENQLVEKDMLLISIISK